MKPKKPQQRLLAKPSGLAPPPPSKPKQRIAVGDIVAFRVDDPNDLREYTGGIVVQREDNLCLVRAHADGRVDGWDADELALIFSGNKPYHEFDDHRPLEVPYLDEAQQQQDEWPAELLAARLHDLMNKVIAFGDAKAALFSELVENGGSTFLERTAANKFLSGSGSV